jgi:hypothetical protein
VSRCREIGRARRCPASIEEWVAMPPTPSERQCPSWVKLVVLTVRRSLPVYPDNRTSSVSGATSQTCRNRKWPALKPSPPLVVRTILASGDYRVGSAHPVQGAELVAVEIT